MVYGLSSASERLVSSIITIVYLDVKLLASSPSRMSNESELRNL